MFEMLHQLLGAVLGAQEDDGAAIGVFGERLLEEIGLVVLAVDEVNILLDLVGGLARRRHFDLDRIGQEVGGEIGDRLRHRGGEEHRLATLRHHLGDLAQVMHEAEVEHLVGFVEHEVAHGGQADGAAGDEIEQAAGGGDQDVGALFKLQLLLVDRHAADDDVDAQMRLAQEVLQVLGDLVHQFAGRRQDQRTGGTVVGAAFFRDQLFDQRQAEGGRLAGAGLGEADQVAAFEKKRDRLFLDGGRRFDAELEQCGDDRLGDTKRFKIGQVITFSGAPKQYRRNAGLRSGVTLASRTPREVGTCLVGKSFPALLPRPLGCGPFEMRFVLLPASYLLAGARSRGGRKVKAGLHLV